MSYQFPDFTEKDVQKQISRMWDMSGPVPVPKFNPDCPYCAHDEVLLKHARFHLRNNKRSQNPHRCDIGMKCTACSAVWQHGLVIPEDMFPGKQIWGWQKMKEELESAE
jgi:hypothetical protein